MLRGLPFSNVLGRWSGHSWISSGSSGPTSFSCEPVWCMCAHEWSARCPSGCLYEKVPKDHDMMHGWYTWSCSLQGSQHHPRTYNGIKHLLHSLLQIVSYQVQPATHMMLQRYTKPNLFHSACIFQVWQKHGLNIFIQKSYSNMTCNHTML